MEFEGVRIGNEVIKVVSEGKKLLFDHRVVSKGNSLIAGNQRIKTVIYNV